jgi:hypothetical protein
MDDKNEKRPADNKRFGEIGGEVIIRISVYPLTVGVNPNFVQLSPNFAKPPGRYLQADELPEGK